MGTSDYKYIHCTQCREEGKPRGVAVFVTPTGALGIVCIKHSDFVMTIPNEKVSEFLMDVAMEGCGSGDGCKSKEITH